MDKEVSFSFFHNNMKHKLVNDYFNLRGQVFKSYWNLEHFSGEEDAFDQDAYILILHKNNKCIGGARLVVHSPENNSPLPLETEGFQIKDLFPNLHLDKTVYAELSRVVLDEGYRKGGYSSFLYYLIGQKSQSLNIKYVFACAPLCQARMSKIACRKVGIPLEIKHEVNVPELPTYEGKKMYLF